MVTVAQMRAIVELHLRTVELAASPASVTAVQTALSPAQRLLHHRLPPRPPARFLLTVHAVVQPALPALAPALVIVVASTGGAVALPITAAHPAILLSVHAQVVELLRPRRLPPLLPHQYLPRRLPLMEAVREQKASLAPAPALARVALNIITAVPPAVTAELDARRPSESALKQCPPPL